MRYRVKAVVNGRSTAWRYIPEGPFSKYERSEILLAAEPAVTVSIIVEPVAEPTKKRSWWRFWS
jgi:hypothetical protein